MAGTPDGQTAHHAARAAPQRDPGRRPEALLTHGVQATAIDQIAAQAGVAKGTIYLSFGSKEAIIIALGDRFAQILHDRVAAAVAQHPHAPWTQRLAVWLRACVDGYLDVMRLHDLVFYGWRPATRDGMIDNSLITHLTGLLQEGGRAGAWAVDDARTTAVFVFSGLHAAVDNAVAQESHINRARLVRRIERLARGAVGISSP